MTRHFAAIAFAVVSLASADASAFCGFYVSGADTKLFNDATNVVLMRDGTRTVLSMQNAYKGPPEAFAMVVPVPVVLHKENVKTLPRDVFDRVDQLAASIVGPVPELGLVVAAAPPTPVAATAPKKKSGCGCATNDPAGLPVLLAGFWLAIRRPGLRRRRLMHS